MYAGNTTSKIDIENIEASLKRIQDDFERINNSLSLHRDPLDDTILQNMVLGYEELNKLLGNDVMPFSDLLSVLELNHIVLGVSDDIKKLEYHNYVNEAEKHFFKKVKPIKQYYYKNKDKEPFEVVSKVYTKIVSKPQLFISDGNHRTGALIISWILVDNGLNPFVLTTENAYDYFEISSNIKLSDKSSFRDKIKLWKYSNAFRDFLEQYNSQ